MSISAKFSHEQQRSVQHYLKGLRQLKSLHGEIAAELLISINSDQLTYPYRYIRVDAATKGQGDTPEMHEVRTELDTQFEPMGYNFGTFTVEVRAFTWDSIQIAFDQPPKSIKQIEGWFTRWLDAEGSKTAGGDGTLGVVHSVTPIESNGTWWYLTADFGTAPSDALLEFVELLAGQGMNRILIQHGRGDA